MRFQIANTAVIVTVKPADIKAIPNCGFRPLGTRFEFKMIYQLDTRDWEMASDLPGGNDRPAPTAFRAAVAEFIDSGGLDIASRGASDIEITVAGMVSAIDLSRLA